MLLGSEMVELFGHLGDLFGLIGNYGLQILVLRLQALDLFLQFEAIVDPALIPFRVAVTLQRDPS